MGAGVVVSPLSLPVCASKTSSLFRAPNFWNQILRDHCAASCCFLNGIEILLDGSFALVTSGGDQISFDSLLPLKSILQSLVAGRRSRLVMEQVNFRKLVETSMFHSSIKKTLRLEPYAHIRPAAKSYLLHDSQDSILYLYRSTQNLVWELARRRQRVLRTASRESGTCSVAIVL
ncbi:hypothetical protein SISSUDRAFT_704932 [Sistotremastrum suecicum HHB10207 ss-3]|uniref:Uncharacterized protein n=1 Tax=Sistotremastrum suecicum HHB10207 ss-3 TaxID=1314776 RepID=A0A166DT78_9AGAM|nr:hypothetical protein SISSUDRAFT_704932 [Sistotremastrum suecicum HHB10207 ss-3]